MAVKQQLKEILYPVVLYLFFYGRALKTLLCLEGGLESLLFPSVCISFIVYVLPVNHRQRQFSVPPNIVSLKYE